MPIYFPCQIADFASYANVNIPDVIGDVAKQTTNSLKNASGKLFCWFVNNQLKGNPDKHCLIISCSN